MPLDSKLPEDVRNDILNERDGILRKVKEYSDKLNPEKHNILNPLEDKCEKVLNIPDILKELNLTENQYCDALSVPNDSEFEIHLKCQKMYFFISSFLKEVASKTGKNWHTVSL